MFKILRAIRAVSSSECLNLRAKGMLFSLIFALVLVAPLTGCGSNKGKDTDIGKPYPLEKIDVKTKFKRHWSRGVGSGQGKFYNRLTLGLGSGDIYAASNNGIAARYNASGKKIWSKKLKVTLTGGIGVGDGLALVATADGIVIALKAEDGSEVWRTDVQGEVLAAPQVAKGYVLVQTHDGRLMGLAAASGEELWVYTSDLPLLTLRGTATPVIEGNIAYTGFASGKIIAINIENGSLLWDKSVAIAKGQAEIDRVVDVDGSPLVSSTSVYAASFNGNLYAFTKRSGQAKWRFETSSYRGLAEGFGNIYLVNEQGRIYALDAASGDQRWEQSALLNRRLSAPIVFSGFVLVADYDGYIHVLSQVDGSIVGRARIDGSGVRVPMLVAENQLYVYSNNGKLATYSLKNIR